MKDVYGEMEQDEHQNASHADRKSQLERDKLWRNIQKQIEDENRQSKNAPESDDEA